MRERVLDAIYKKLEDEPNNLNIQKQIGLLGKSNICTIHSFCLDVIRNNFFEINISPNFRIGSEEEIVLMKQEILDEVFDENYEKEDKDFIKLIDTYATYRGDEKLKSIVLKLYEFSQSDPYPIDWLEEKTNMFNMAQNYNKDFSKTVWGQILLKELEESIIDGKNNLRMIQNKMIVYNELDKFTSVISSDIDCLRNFENAIKTSWDSAFEFGINFSFDRWPTDKNITIDLKDEAKEIRSNIKDKIKEKVKDILLYNSEAAYKDIYEMYNIINSLKKLVIQFDKKFKEEKLEKNIIDFNDIEHYALNILVKKDENGNIIPTDVAKKYAEKFEEIAIDEYQDSNQIQEEILKAVSRNNNIFMVGDIKQSIYKFRRACPDLFLNKYQTYSLDENQNGLKIKLFKNFRSRKNILDVTNIIFKNIMSNALGEIDYNEDEFLNLGADFEEIDNSVTKSEVCVIDNYIEEPEENDEALEEIEIVKKEELEAKYISDRIRQMIDKKINVKDKKTGFRPIKYKDIVILLRSTKMADIFEKELLKKNIPVFTDGISEYLETIEIQTIMNLLKILDNPLDDISVVSVLRSAIFDFSDNEIIEIRLVNKDTYFWNTLLEAKTVLENVQLREKLENFISIIEKWREQKDYLLISEFIWNIYVETGFYNYVALMPNGALRQANLKMLFERARDYEKTSFKGLFNFIRFIEKLKLGNSDLSSAKIIGENEDVVRIMSIHKSKGLEFPIVFLGNCSKKINLEDLKGELLLHKDLGFGPEYINSDRKISYSTLAKEAMKIKLREENISEEMRILYVALTRAKEKLILTAVRKDEQKNLTKKKELLEIYSKTDKISPILLKKNPSYLDWIELVKISSDISNKGLDCFEFNIIKPNQFIEEDEASEDIKVFDFQDNNIEEIEEKLNWKYDNEFLSNLPIKTTVSTIKQIENEKIDFFDLNKDKIGLAEVVPVFLSNEEITGAKVGTIMHLILQKINFNSITSENDINDLIKHLVVKKFIKESEAKKINISKIMKFLDTDLVKQIKESKNVYKEKAFCLKMDASRIFEDCKNNEKILVQGIIDLYFINKNGNIVLLDYKTDFVDSETELIDKYKIQLELYKQALEESTGLKVEKSYIYSLFLNKAIEV